MTARQREYEHEQISDPRRADVEYSHQLIDAAQQSGLVALPSLTVDELLVLGAGEQAVLDETLLHAWERLPDERRFQLADDALAGLVERELLEPMPDESAAVAASHGSDAAGPDGEDRVQMRMHPALATILLARTHPTWVGLCSMQDGRRTDLRMFGFGDTQDAYRAVVVETVERRSEEKQALDSSGDAAATSYCYRLASTAVAAALLADWAVAPRASADRAGRPARVARLIDLFARRDGEQLIRRRTETYPDGQGAAYVVTGPGKHEPYDHGGLARLLHNTIRTLRSP